MTKFKVGDKVRVIKPDTLWNGTGRTGFTLNYGDMHIISDLIGDTNVILKDDPDQIHWQVLRFELVAPELVGPRVGTRVITSDVWSKKTGVLVSPPSGSNYPFRIQLDDGSELPMYRDEFDVLAETKTKRIDHTELVQNADRWIDALNTTEQFGLADMLEQLRDALVEESYRD